jgi:putative endonuclease
MYYVYVLYSKTRNECYTGYSSNLKERIKDHFTHNVYTTKRMGELELIFYEAYISKSDAQRRELYLKTTKGKRTLKLMLADYFSRYRPEA